MTRTFQCPQKAAQIILSLHWRKKRIISPVLFSYPSHKVMWCTSSNHNAPQSSVRGDVGLESIFLTTLGAQEWAQYGLNSCGLLQGWIEIALLNSRLADSRYRKRCFLFIQIQRLCFSREHKGSVYVGGFCNSVEVAHTSGNPAWQHRWKGLFFFLHLRKHNNRITSTVQWLWNFLHVS